MYRNYNLQSSVLILISFLILNGNIFSQTCDSITNNITNLGIYGGLASDLTFSPNGRLFATTLEPASLFISDDTGQTFYRAFPNDSILYECGQRGWGGGGVYTYSNIKGWIATFTKENAGSLSAIEVSFQNGDTGTWKTAIDPYLLNSMGYSNDKVNGMGLSDYYIYGLLRNYIVKINDNGFDSSDIINIYDQISGLDSLDYARSIAIANSPSGFPFYVVIDSSESTVNSPNGKLYKYDGSLFTQISIPSILSGLSAVYTPSGLITGDTIFIVGRQASNAKPKTYSSYNGGVTWKGIDPGADIKDVDYSQYWQSILPQSNGTVLITGGTYPKVSYDMGASWINPSTLPSTSNVTLYPYTLCFSPNDTSIVIASNTIGVYVSSTGFNGTFIKENAEGLEAILVKSIDRNKSEGIFYLATYSGIAYTTKYKDTTIAAKDKWKPPYRIFPIDSTESNSITSIAIDHNDSLHVIAGSLSNIFYTKTGPNGFKNVAPKNYQQGGSITNKIVFVNSNVAIAVTGTTTSYYVGNGDISPINFGTGRTAAVQFLDSDTIVYVGSGLNDVEDGYLWKSTDLGLTWAIVNNGPHAFSDTSITNLPIQDIAIHSDSIYITACYIDLEAFILSTDKGATYQYLNISSLSNDVRCIEIDNENPDSIIYLSAGKYMYVYNPALDTTTLFFTSLPGDIIFDLSIGSILVGTTTGFYSINFEPFEDLILGINTNNISPDLYLDSYPNPGIDNIFLKTNCNKCNGKLYLYNIIGIKIMEICFTKTNHSINVQNIPSGTYFIEGKIDNEIVSHKVIIVH